MEYIEKLKGIKEKDLKSFIVKSLAEFQNAKRVLVLFPDYTRIDFTEAIAPLIVERYKNSILHFLNAGGTHRPMAGDEFMIKLGLDDSDPGVSFLNHDFSNPENLVKIGCIPKELVSEKTGGQLNTDIDITINKIVFSGYDLIIALSGTVPHEAAGYSGGLKIFFPGISGPEVIDLFHWAAVLVGIPKIIGTVDNNARDIINTGAKVIFDKIKAPIYSFNMVNTETDEKVVPIGLYADRGYQGFLATYKAASAASSVVHVKYIDSPLTQVVQVIPDNYDEIWLAGKGSYKLQRPGVLAPGAEVIMYAPHINRLHSNTKIQKELYDIGYHCRDYVCKKLRDGLKISRNAAAHVINASGPGTYDPVTGVEKKSFRLTLTTAIPKKDCDRLGLGYRNPKTLKKSDFLSPGKLWIDNGAKYLYELKKENKKK